MIAKGQIQPDYAYQYTCGHCSGVGFLLSTGKICPHCYNLDLPRLLEAFQTARGSRYYALLKAILSIQGKAICDRYLEIYAERGNHWIVIDYGRLVLEFGWGKRMKPLAEWLEECRLIPTGTYEKIRERGPKIGDIIAGAQREFDL